MSNSRGRRLRTTVPSLVLAGLLAALVGGCQPAPEAESESASLTETYPREFLKTDWETQEVPVAHLVRRDYRIREGDFLEIIYHVKHRTSEEYRIKVQDVIDVRFPFNAQLNQTETVQSDGKLYLDLIEPQRVIGRTIEEVRSDLQIAYAKYVKNPNITLSFKQSNVKTAELKKAITTSPRGQSRLVPVTPDGTISLPFIVDIRAAGRTISELHKALNDAYKEIDLPQLEVTVNLQQVAPLRVYVLGEVRSPGVLLNRSGTSSDIGSITLLQALAQAGSYRPRRAELSQVVLIRRRHLPRPQAAIINVHQLLENRSRQAGEPVVADMSKYRYDIWLEDGDIIYVPTTEIAKRADYIEYVWSRGIRAVGGFTSDYSVGDSVDWLGPNP
ncbi:MAG: polysaccharide biosynthesis/export family protein [Phycisphaerae bacterium]|nr:polysaccharide biosynthesis/export family protein [Phycisphaerae bacterium]